MKPAAFLALILILNMSAYALINEIMYDPQGSDVGHEWIEIYNSNDFEINLSGWKLYEAETNHGLVLKQGSFIIQPKSYAIIADDWSGFLLDYADFNGTLIDSVFSLSNTGETIALKNASGEIIENFTYASSFGGNGNGFSIGFLDGWKETMPTPGKENAIKENQSINQTEEPKEIEDQSEIKNQNSSIIIIDSPDSAYFGDLIYITFYVYKGNTSKYAIYSYVENEDSREVSSKNTTHFKGKFLNATFTAPIQLNSRCYEEGNYFIVVEGLGLREEKQISLQNKQDCDDETEESETSSKKSFIYELEYKPEVIRVGEKFSIQVRIETSEATNIEIWSYVYRGSKSYSGEREANKQIVSLPANSATIVTLENTVLDAEPGDYKLKVKIKKDDLKTLKEITSNMTIIRSEEIQTPFEAESEEDETEQSSKEEVSSREKQTLEDMTGLSVLVYESSQAKAEKLTTYFLLILMTITTIFLAFKRL